MFQIPPDDSPKKPSSPPPNFDWEKAAQNIVKNNRKNTAHIHIPPENGFLMTEFPKDRYVKLLVQNFTTRWRSPESHLRLYFVSAF